MKIAVVGSGVSGLVAAYYLSRTAEVHMFEALDYVGGHTNTVDVRVASGNYAIDTGFIVFNDRTYPRFLRLMSELGVEAQPSNMSFSVKVEKSGLEYNGTDINRLFAQRTNFFNVAFYRMILDILRFNREAPGLLNNPNVDPTLSLGRYLTDNGYSPEFMDQYIIPMGAAIWSAGVETMKEFPVAYFVQFFKNHGMLSVNDRPLWKTVRKGSRAYIDPITAPFRERLHLKSAVRSVRRDDRGVVLAIEKNGAVEEARFDHVVMAGHADQSLALLADPSDQERQMLSAFPYQKNDTTLHTDTSVLPSRPLAWAAWNYLVPKSLQSTVAVTYNMNILQSISSPETFLVSLNMDDRIDSKKILKKIVYHHPVYSVEGVAAQKQWNTISGVRNTHYCGAYWSYGFHEDGVVSGERVAASLGVPLP